MSQKIRRQRGHLVFLVGTKKLQTWKRTLRSCFLSSFVAFRSVVSEEKSEMSQQIRYQNGHLVFQSRSEKHKHGRGRCDLEFHQVSLNSVQRFQGRCRKCLSQSEARGHLVFPIGRKKNLVEDVGMLLPVKYRWIPFSGFRGEVENVSTYQRLGRPSCFCRLLWNRWTEFNKTWQEWRS